PFARSSSFFRFARRTDPLFTLGIVYSSCKSETRSLVGQHPVQLGGVVRRHLLRPAHAALGLRGLAGQDVTLEGAGPDDLAGTGLLEALGGAAMCLQLWHLNPFAILRSPRRHHRRQPWSAARSCDSRAGSG